MKNLMEVLENYRNSSDLLERDVADYFLTYSEDKEDIERHFDDVLHYGTNNGSVHFLIYYEDTHKFFDTYYEEIEEMRELYAAGTGEALLITGDLKDFLAKFAFEVVVNKIQIEIECN